MRWLAIFCLFVLVLAGLPCPASGMTSGVASVMPKTMQQAAGHPTHCAPCCSKVTLGGPRLCCVATPQPATLAAVRVTHPPVLASAGLLMAQPVACLARPLAHAAQGAAPSPPIRLTLRL